MSRCTADDCPICPHTEEQTMFIPCPKCGGKMRNVPCPDPPRPDGFSCAVLHFACDRCDADKGEPIHPSADRIPRIDGALPWRDSDWACPDDDEFLWALESTQSPFTPKWKPLWAGVAMLCLMLSGCQFIAYQHFDYRSKDARNDERPDGANHRCENGEVVHLAINPVFPGLFGISPGLDELASTAGPGTVVGHSAGGPRAARFAADRGLSLLLVDPWPPNLEVPPGVPVVYVVTGRPGRVTVAPGTKLVELSHAGGACPWAWTIGHIYACRWPESVEAAVELSKRPNGKE